MEKNYRRILICGLLVLVFVVITVFLTVLFQQRIDGYENEYQKTVESQKSLIKDLEKKVEELEEESMSLQEELQEALVADSELVTQSQAFSDLRDIFLTFRSGEEDRARDIFEKIEPMGFDDSTLAYYELLKEYLKK